MPGAGYCPKIWGEDTEKESGGDVIHTSRGRHPSQVRFGVTGSDELKGYDVTVLESGDGRGDIAPIKGEVDVAVYRGRRGIIVDDRALDDGILDITLEQVDH